MKWLSNYKLFKESKQEKAYPAKALVHEICTGMVLLNNEFLDNILDRGLRARYSEDSAIFLTDLKNLLLAKNRLRLGMFKGETCVEDEEISRVNGMFDGLDFNIERDWEALSNSRATARAIMDKLLPDEKLHSDMIRRFFWMGPNKSKDNPVDAVIELHDGRQFQLYLNKSISSSRSASFNAFADELIGEDLERLFGEEYMPRWNKLTQQWIKLMYENANKAVQRQIEKFIDPRRVDTIDYFEYFDIKHQDPRFKHLGEHMPEFGKNILNFSDLLNEVWKNRKSCFIDPQRVEKEWYETKVVILNSKILENLLTKSLKKGHAEDIARLEDGMKRATGVVKMKLFKTVVEKLGCEEKSVYFVGNGGKSFTMLPGREFFRKFYEDMEVKFDYHVNFSVGEDEESNDFKIRIDVDLDGQELIRLSVSVKFTGGEMSGKLGAKYRFELPWNFSYLIQKKSDGQ